MTCLAGWENAKFYITLRPLIMASDLHLDFTRSVHRPHTGQNLRRHLISPLRADHRPDRGAVPRLTKGIKRGRLARFIVCRPPLWEEVIVELVVKGRRGVLALT